MEPCTSKEAERGPNPPATTRSILRARSELRAPSQRDVRAWNRANVYWIVDQKEKWTEPISAADKVRGFLGWHTRGYLPHFDAPGVTQFVTFRLMDAMPAERRNEWECL